MKIDNETKNYTFYEMCEFIFIPKIENMLEAENKHYNHLCSYVGKTSHEPLATFIENSLATMRSLEKSLIEYKKYISDNEK